MTQSEPRYWTLKVHINTLRHNQELLVYRHLAQVDTPEDDPGRPHIRQLESFFKLDGPCGKHEVFVMEPMGMSLATFQDMHKGKVFHKALVTSALDKTLLGLNLLHEAGVVHTDLHSGNLLIALTDTSVLADMEQREAREPSARKTTDNTTIYVSRYMLGGAGPLTLCDFGQARIGHNHQANAMPLPYRAPQVILDMVWNSLSMFGPRVCWYAFSS